MLASGKRKVTWPYFLSNIKVPQKVPQKVPSSTLGNVFQKISFELSNTLQPPCAGLPRESSLALPAPLVVLLRTSNLYISMCISTDLLAGCRWFWSDRKVFSNDGGVECGKTPSVPTCKMCDKSRCVIYKAQDMATFNVQLDSKQRQAQI